MKRLPTTDYMYNMTSRNITDWLVKTTDDYIKKRYVKFNRFGDYLFLVIHHNKFNYDGRMIVTSIIISGHIYYCNFSNKMILSTLRHLALDHNSSKWWLPTQYYVLYIVYNKPWYFLKKLKYVWLLFNREFTVKISLASGYLIFYWNHIAILVEKQLVMITALVYHSYTF